MRHINLSRKAKKKSNKKKIRAVNVIFAKASSYIGR
jgi:hypothetical protein